MTKPIELYVDLICDECGKHIAHVYDFDLNDSYFACDECFEKGKREDGSTKNT